MKATEQAQLRAENEALRAQFQTLLEAAIATAQARIADLEERPPQPPAFVKANKPPPQPKPRQQRAATHKHGRRFEAPTQVVQHALTHCPDCQRHLIAHLQDFRMPRTIAFEKTNLHTLFVRALR